MHSKEFAGNQGKPQNFDPSVLSSKFGLIFMGMKHFFQKAVKFSWAARMGRNFDIFPGFRKIFPMHNFTLYRVCVHVVLLSFSA